MMLYNELRRADGNIVGTTVAPSLYAIDMARSSNGTVGG